MVKWFAFHQYLMRHPQYIDGYLEESPPLRQRKKDIPLLVQSFVDRYARKLGKQITSINVSTMKALENYPWPGNIRELESVVERTVILCSGSVFELADKLEISSIPLSSGMETLKEIGKTNKENFLLFPLNLVIANIAISQPHKKSKCHEGNHP